MTIIISILIIVGAFICGCFLFKKLDRFLTEEIDTKNTSGEKESPTCIILDGNTADETVIEEIRQFRNTHTNIRIILCDPADIDFNIK